MSLRSIPFPTRRLAIATAAVAILWLIPGRAGIVLAAGALLAVMIATIVDAVRLPPASGVDVERQIPDSVGVGDTVEGEYVLRSRWASPVKVALYDAPGAGVIRHREPPFAVSLPPHGERIVPLELEGRRRGSWPLGPIALRVHTPLGLVQRTLRYDEGDARIAVTPSVTGVRRYRLLTLQHRMKDLGVRSTRRRGEGTTFSHLREYQIGDDPRHIDWKATARRRQLIAREYTLEQGQTVVIAIDLGRMMTQFAGPLPRLEYALNASLVLADVVASSGDRVGVIAFDDAVRAFVPPLGGPGAVPRVREALVPLRATMVEPDYALAFRTLTARHRKRSLIVLFTDVIDVRASQALISHTTRSVARHLPLVVALRNEQLLAAATTPSAGRPAALYERAAAEELLQARDEALLRMRRAGVSVLDVPPEAMTAPVINRYLELKARASL
ncbi:MAG TPA: DUF58 domain-containing protein [Gemmatimonadaceae bacterium]|nr:DUF58 domain-containing protein [Gemmatimonadaceae bacterium]